MAKRRFTVVEYASGYAVRDNTTGKEHWMSDGVDVLFYKSGKAMSPGTERFRKAWEKALNESESETEEAYFSGVPRKFGSLELFGGSEPIRATAKISVMAKKYQVRMAWGDQETKTVRGYKVVIPLPGVEDLQFFVHRSPSEGVRGWFVSEVSSGARISMLRNAKRREDAVRSAIETIHRFGAAFLREEIARVVEEHGKLG